MNRIGQGSVADDSSTEEASANGLSTIEGERGVPSVNRARSLASRVSTILAVGLMSSLGLGLLTWYYARALSQGARAQKLAQVAARSKAQGEMTLPSIRITPPTAPRAPMPAPATPSPEVSPLARVLGPAPPPPPEAPASALTRGGPIGQAESAGPRVDRRLSGPVFERTSAEGPAGSGTAAAEPSQPVELTGAPAANPPGRAGAADPLGQLLEPTATPAVRARLLPTRRFLLPKGAFIDCTLETAIDSTYPGLTTCVTATDTFSADGEVVLLERGTKLVGETRGDVAQGSSRLFVLWSEARTPTGVVIPLASPGTDELGRSGLSGQVNRHFWQRFGAAMLITVVDGAVQAAALSAQSGNNAIIYSPTTSGDIVEEVLKGTIAIPPTVTKAQGDRIQVLVARDLDFRSVYELRTVGTH